MLHRQAICVFRIKTDISFARLPWNFKTKLWVYILSTFLVCRVIFWKAFSWFSFRWWDLGTSTRVQKKSVPTYFQIEQEKNSLCDIHFCPYTHLRVPFYLKNMMKILNCEAEGRVLTIKFFTLSYHTNLVLWSCWETSTYFILATKISSSNWEICFTYQVRNNTFKNLV